MKKKIFKYNLQTTDINLLRIPIGAQILSVKCQNNNIRLWALVDPEAQSEERMFEIFGTGNDVPCGMEIERKFIDTVLTWNDSLVWHIFERK